MILTCNWDSSWAICWFSWVSLSKSSFISCGSPLSQSWIENGWQWINTCFFNNPILNICLFWYILSEKRLWVNKWREEVQTDLALFSVTQFSVVKITCQKKNNTSFTPVLLQGHFYWHTPANLSFDKTQDACYITFVRKLTHYLRMTQNLSFRQFLNSFLWKKVWHSLPNQADCQQSVSLQYKIQSVLPTSNKICDYIIQRACYLPFSAAAAWSVSQISAWTSSLVDKLRSLHCTLIFSSGPTIIQVR